MRECSWCFNQIENGPCPHCEEAFKRPIPTTPKRQAEEIHSLCQKLVGASTGQFPLEIGPDIVVGRLTKLVGREVTNAELLKPEILVAEAAPVLSGDGDDILVKLATKHDVPVGKLTVIIQEYENWRAGR